MKVKISSVIKSLLTAYALTVSFHLPLQRIHYETTMDFLLASVYELLGSYNFTFIIIGILTFFFFEKHRLRKMKSTVHSSIVAAFFAGSLLLGNSFYETNSWVYCFGSIVNLIKTGIAFAGLYMLFQTLVDFLFELFEEYKSNDGKKHFFSKHAFAKSFGILSAVYLLVLLFSFPGDLCYDVIGQIEQVTVENVGFSQHHPLMHTLLVGGLVQLGEVLFNSKEIGLFVYMLVQNAMIISALSATIAILSKRNVKFGWLLSLILLYCISPIYTNLSSTAIKDIPFAAFIIGYVICYALLLEEPDRVKNVKFSVIFILMQIGAIFMRNNGLPLIAVCGIAGVIFLWKKYDWKKRICSIAVLFGAGILIAKLTITLVATALDATPGGKAEMFSLPMQQTARYLVYYQDELSAEEKAGIEGIFGDVVIMAEAYDPDIADPVKKLFDNEAPMTAVVDYFKAWGIGLCKHPMVYLEAFGNHVYGWFTPGVTSALRYEVEYEPIEQGMLFPMAEKVVIFIYRFLDRIPVIGVLQNAGFYTWLLALLTAYEVKRKESSGIMATVPLWISLLVCMISPCFFLHPRYALPIIMSLPFVFLFNMSRENQQRKDK